MKSRKQCEIIRRYIAILETKSVSNTKCKVVLHITRSTVTVVKKTLKDIEQRARIKPRSTRRVKKRLRAPSQSDIQSVLSTISAALRQAWANALNKIAGRESKFEAFFKKISLIDAAIADEIKAVRSWNGYSMPTKRVDPALIVPGAFVLLLIFLITMILSMRLFYRRGEISARSSRSSKASSRRLSDRISVAGCYVIVFVAFLVIRIKCLDYLDIWRISTICQPLFEDKNYSVYEGLDKIVDVPGVAKFNVSVREVLIRCREQQTIFKAVGADTAVNSTTLLKEITWPLVKQKTEELFNAVLQQGFQSQTMQMAQLVNSSEIKEKLKSCETTDPHIVRKIAEEFSSLSRSLANIRDDVEKTIKNSSTGGSEMKLRLKALQRRLMNRAEGPLIRTVDTFLGELSTNVFSCSSLHAAYENIGKILCENASSPTQNLLTSAGLAGSWFAPASVVAVLSGLHGMCSVSNLLCIYVHYRFTKRRRRKRQKTDDDSSRSSETI